MINWIPLLQVLVWPVFIGIILFLNRKYVKMIINSISVRIKSGDPFQAGPSGFSLGQSDRKLTRLNEGEGEVKKAGTGIPLQYNDTGYLIHHAAGLRNDPDGIERRDIQVILIADSEAILKNVERVVYYLHPTFPRPTREVKDRNNHFELITRAWGEFNLSADVYFKGYSTPLRLYRYINFPWPS